MDSRWRRLEKLEQRAEAQQPEAFDPAIFDLLTEDELELVEYAAGIMEELKGIYRADLGTEDDQIAQPSFKTLLMYATDEQLELLEKAAGILDRAKEEYKPHTGNGHTMIVHRQKTRGHPWKV